MVAGPTTTAAVIIGATSVRQEEVISRLRLHTETHLVQRIGWLRVAVLGANDGIMSTASLIVGVAAASARQNDILVASVAGLVAGAMSMAAGEYVIGELARCRRH